jgi:hypothetical protein
MGIDEHDQRMRRCPRLGHDIKFEYCRQGSGVSGRDCPCRKILDCWFEMFAVEEFVRAHYGDKTIEDIAAPPEDKLSSIVALVQQAQERAQRNSGKKNTDHD